MLLASPNAATNSSKNYLVEDPPQDSPSTTAQLGQRTRPLTQSRQPVPSILWSTTLPARHSVSSLPNQLTCTTSALPCKSPSTRSPSHNVPGATASDTKSQSAPAPPTFKFAITAEATTPLLNINTRAKLNTPAPHATVGPSASFAGSLASPLLNASATTPSTLHAL